VLRASCSLVRLATIAPSQISLLAHARLHFSQRGLKLRIASRLSWEKVRRPRGMFRARFVTCSPVRSWLSSISLRPRSTLAGF